MHFNECGPPYRYSSLAPWFLPLAEQLAKTRLVELVLRRPMRATNGRNPSLTLAFATSS